MNASESPRCLHNWPPHEGKPLSSLFFLDNHQVRIFPKRDSYKNWETDLCLELQNYEITSNFWKIAVTGADNNSELKVWSCESWSCLQTIRFEPDETGAKPVFKAALDPSGNYILLSEINRGVIYALRFVQVS